jgi:hypothetical protein
MNIRKFKGYFISDRKPEIGDKIICTNKKSVNYGLTSEVKTLFMFDPAWLVIVGTAPRGNHKSGSGELQVFMEVKTDYIVSDTGYVAIDAYINMKDDDAGKCLGYVTPDGEFIKNVSKPGDTPMIEEVDFECCLVKEAIKAVTAEQLEIKQRAVDAVIEDLIKGFKVGDYTVLEELLKFTPMVNLIGSLPEEQWKDYEVKGKFS